VFIIKLLQLYLSYNRPSQCTRRCIYCDKNNHISLNNNDYKKNMIDIINYYKKNHIYYDMTDITISSCDGGQYSYNILVELMDVIKKEKTYSILNTHFRFLSTCEYVSKENLNILENETIMLSIDGTYETMKQNRRTTKKEWNHIQELIDYTYMKDIEFMISSTFYPNRNSYEDIKYIQQLLKNDLSKWRHSLAFGDNIWTYTTLDNFFIDLQKFSIEYLSNNNDIPKENFLKNIGFKLGRTLCSSTCVLANKNANFSTCLKTYTKDMEYSPFIYNSIIQQQKQCNECLYKPYCILCPYDMISMCFLSKEIYCYAAKKFYELQNILKGL